MVVVRFCSEAVLSYNSINSGKRRLIVLNNMRMLATPSSLWILAVTICSPLALPRTQTCGVLLLCRCCHRPEVPDTGSTLAVTLSPLRWLPLQNALRIRDYNRDSARYKVQELCYSVA